MKETEQKELERERLKAKTDALCAERIHHLSNLLRDCGHDYRIDPMIRDGEMWAIKISLKHGEKVIRKMVTTTEIISVKIDILPRIADDMIKELCPHLIHRVR